MKSATHPWGLDDQEVHHPQRGLGFPGVLGVHLPLAFLGFLGGPSFQPVQEAPHPLAVLSSPEHLRQSTGRLNSSLTHRQGNRVMAASMVHPGPMKQKQNSVDPLKAD